jgi:hypothetical protein
LHSITISLTTINARLGSVGETIKTLLNQAFPESSYKIRLYVSESPYLLDHGCKAIPSGLKEVQASSKGRFEIVFVENTGPYRKLIPLLDEVYKLPQREFLTQLLVTADDDTMYPPHWLATLYESYRKYSCIVAFRGRSIRLSGNKIAPYGQWSKQVDVQSSLFHVATGKDGVLYSPLFLDPDILDMSTALSLAPTADDLWVKVHSLLTGTPTVILQSSITQSLPSVEGATQTPSLYEKFNRKGGNDSTVERLDEYVRSQIGVGLAALCCGSGSLIARRAQSRIIDLLA